MLSEERGWDSAFSQQGSLIYLLIFQVQERRTLLSCIPKLLALPESKDEVPEVRAEPSLRSRHHWWTSAYGGIATGCATVLEEHPCIVSEWVQPFYRDSSYGKEKSTGLWLNVCILTFIKWVYCSCYSYLCPFKTQGAPALLLTWIKSTHLNATELCWCKSSLSLKTCQYHVWLHIQGKTNAKWMRWDWRSVPAESISRLFSGAYHCPVELLASFLHFWKISTEMAMEIQAVYLHYLMPLQWYCFG